MTRAAVRQADIVRAVKAMEAAGWARGSFKVVIEGARIEVLPLDADRDEAADIGRRIEDALGDDDRAPALHS
jgi:hypothetical protein